MKGAVPVLVGVLTIGAQSAAQQTPVRDTKALPAPPAAMPAGTASLAGTVLTEGGRPIGVATVVLIGTVQGTVRATSTDRAGRFAFDKLAADRYLVAASKTPYVGMVAGAHRPGRPGVAIPVSDGQRAADVTITLPMGAAISGTVLDNSGGPVARAQVMVSQWKMQGLDRVIQNAPVSANTVATDESGRYRFFGLPPGEYLVSVMTGGVKRAPQPDADVDRALAGEIADLRTAFTPQSGLGPIVLFHPSVARPADATPIVVRAGDDRTGIDIRVTEVPVTHIEGVLLDINGQPAPNVSVTLTGVTGASVVNRIRSAMPQRDGRFVFDNIEPGSYQLFASTTGAAAGQHFAVAPIEATGADITGVQLRLRPAMTLALKVAFDGPAPPSLASRQLAVKPMTNQSMFASPSVTSTNQAGDAVATRLVPGRFLIGAPLNFGPAAPDTVKWALDSVVLDGKDVTDLPVDINADTPPRQAVVTYTDRWQQLSGRLLQGGQPANDQTVVIFPPDRAYWYQGSRRIQTARPGADGQYVLGGQGPLSLPPGQYLLAAVGDLARDEQFDPSLLATLAPVGIPITIAPGERKTQDIAIR